MIHYHRTCFFLCTEGLTTLLNHVKETSLLEEVRVCREAPTITNLLVVDDSLILMKANSNNANTLINIWAQNCEPLGYMMSADKSSIFLSPCTDVGVRVQVCNILHTMTEALNDKYLGLPAHVGLDKTYTFQHLIDHVWQRLMAGKRDNSQQVGKKCSLKKLLDLYHHMQC